MFDPDKVARFDSGDWFSDDLCVAAEDYDQLLTLYHNLLERQSLVLPGLPIL